MGWQNWVDLSEGVMTTNGSLGSDVVAGNSVRCIKD